MDKLRIVSYNCRGIKSSLPVIHELCTDNDIVLPQETLLWRHNLHFINSIHSDCYAGGCTSVDSSERVVMGRPYGGLWILWRKPLGPFVTLKQYTERIICIEVKGSTNLLLLNVYLPYDNNKCESLDNYMQILAEISAIIQNGSTQEVVIMGDFNADFKRRFAQKLRTFANENELHISDGILPGFDSYFYTYISEAHSSVPWLDHVVCTGTSNRKIVSCSILDGLAVRDHMPLNIIYSYSCDADINNVPQNESACNIMPSVNWSSATDEQLLEYNLLTDILLSSANINVDTFACNDEQCCNADHHSDIDSLYAHC